MTLRGSSVVGERTFDPVAVVFTIKVYSLHSLFKSTLGVKQKVTTINDFETTSFHGLGSQDCH
jgi:hypothetical protein